MYHPSIAPSLVLSMLFFHCVCLPDSKCNGTFSINENWVSTTGNQMNVQLLLHQWELISPSWLVPNSDSLLHFSHVTCCTNNFPALFTRESHLTLTALPAVSVLSNIFPISNLICKIYSAQHLTNRVCICVLEFPFKLKVFLLKK